VAGRFYLKRPDSDTLSARVVVVGGRERDHTRTGPGVQQSPLGGSGGRKPRRGVGSMSTLFVLFESASGFALLEQTESDEIGQYLEEMQTAMCDLSRLSKVLKLKAFVPFKSAEEALAAANDSSEGLLNETLKDFLEMNLPSGKKAEKKGKIELGVLDSKLGSAVQEELGIKCTTRDPVPELLRAVRLHQTRYIKGLEEGDQQKASLGLAHSYSRSKVKFNVNRQDNMIIQSISLLDTLDKDINTFSMRIKEWYGWHFPELVKIVSDNYKYARCVKAVKVRARSARAVGPWGRVRSRVPILWQRAGHVRGEDPERGACARARARVVCWSRQRARSATSQSTCCRRSWTTTRAWRSRWSRPPRRRWATTSPRST
jgi:hypothetical protein